MKKKQTSKRKSKPKTYRRNTKDTRLKTLSTYLLIIFLLLLVSFIGMQIYNTLLQEKLHTMNNHLKKSDDKILQKMRKALERNETIPPAPHTKIPEEKVLKSGELNTTKTTLSKEHNNTKKSVIVVKKEPIVAIKKSHKPYLVIMLDDVSFKHQVDEINALPFKMSPSIFPPTPLHPHTKDFPKYFPFHMIHLPMEAMNYMRPEPSTLLVSDSYDTIENKIKMIRQQFPQARYINNHTGSRFTSNFEAMKKMLKACKKYNFRFVDSLTSSHSQVKRAAEAMGVKVLVRDVFIDNKADISYIHKQLKLAVRKAKKEGQAIVIGHPRPMTLKALRLAKHILKDVETVYLKTLW